MTRVCEACLTAACEPGLTVCADCYRIELDRWLAPQLAIGPLSRPVATGADGAPLDLHPDQLDLRDDLHTLWDGRRGYFTSSRFAGTPLFQPVDADGADFGNPELHDADDHQTEETNQ